jgi:glycosyltransferase involved in cell wall biosynthesis
VVCTRNRARFLEGTLDSVLAQEYPKDRYEIIVVDNNSNDETRPLVAGYRTSASVPVSYYVEIRPGASFARNLGIEMAQHEYVAFLDDDTIAAPGWLAAYETAIRDHGVFVAGGPVEPVPEPGVEVPLCWSDVKNLFGFDHSHLYPRQRVVRIRWPLWLGACNSVYAKRLLQDHGGFRTDCGPVGGRYRVAQDVDLNVRLERAGVAIYYVSDALIKHRITADRLTRRYIWRRTYCAGVTDAHACATLGASSDAGNLRQLARAALQFLFCRKSMRTAAGSGIAYRLGYLRKHWTIMLSNR